MTDYLIETVQISTARERHWFRSRPVYYSWEATGFVGSRRPRSGVWDALAWGPTEAEAIEACKSRLREVVGFRGRLKDLRQVEGTL